MAWIKGWRQWWDLYIPNRNCISLSLGLLSFPSAPLIFLIVATTVVTDNDELRVQYLSFPKVEDSKADVDLVQYTWEIVLFPHCRETFLRVIILHGNGCCFIGFVCHIQWFWKLVHVHEQQITNYYALLWLYMHFDEKILFFFPPGILEVLHCVLVESPEALNIIKEGHIKSIICLLDKHGRNHKVGKD